MKLTKEECEKALSVLKEQHDYLSFMLHSNYPYSIAMLNEVQNCFEQLINEHFDNPPLKFEELQNEMVVWDNKDKQFIQLELYLGWGYSEFGSEDFYTFNFEENRFYRREVKTDE